MAEETPVIRFVKLILFQAIHDQATEITFRLHDPNPATNTAWDQAADRAALHEKIRDCLGPDEAQAFIALLQNDDEPIDLGFSESASLTAGTKAEKAAFQITYLTTLGRREMSPPPNYLYAPAVRVLLHCTRHRFWIRGPVRGEIWLADPDSTWLLTAEDWRREITLKLVTERHEPAGEPGDDESLLPPLADEPTDRVCLTHHQLPELAELPPSQRTKLWRAFCQSRPMRWRMAARALAGMEFVFLGFFLGQLLADVFLTQSMQFQILLGCAISALAIALHQAVHFHSLRPWLRNFLRAKCAN